MRYDIINASGITLRKSNDQEMKHPWPTTEWDEKKANSNDQQLKCDSHQPLNENSSNNNF